MGKSGFVAVMGRPNVGKSTLINALLKQKVAAVSPRAQTTRKRQMGILTLHREEGDAQVVFVDTPGIHKPRHKLGELMNREATETLQECDSILFVGDASQTPQPDDHLLFELLRRLKRPAPIILALNKIDLVETTVREERMQSFQEKLPTSRGITISATQGIGLDELQVIILDSLPEGEPYFPEEQLTDLYERDIAADLIREAALNLLREEVPHGIAVRIDQFTEREEKGAYIEATLFVERESHKPIVIGQGGQMLKKIGTAARKEIEAMSGRKVFLSLRVKTRQGWRNDEKVLKNFGFK
jgi:GTP-binding protein Era